MSFFDPPKFPEPFKPEPLWQMNTCPTCQNNLVCHDQGECLRPTPETDAIRLRQEGLLCGEANLQWAEKLERERDEARQAFALATSQLVQVQSELRQARELVARLRQDLDDPPADVQERVLSKLRSAYANLNTLP